MQKGRSGGEPLATASDFTGPRIEPMTFHSDVCNHCANRPVSFVVSQTKKKIVSF